VSPWQVEKAIAEGIALERNATSDAYGFRALRLDQYQADWTFEYGVPPNPIVVDPEAPEWSIVDDAEGMVWRCGSEVSHGEIVAEHGTFRFPYRSVAGALKRAKGITSATQGQSDARRAGAGWAILIRPGYYDEEPLELDFPVNLIADPNLPGKVAFSKLNRQLEEAVQYNQA
jgi:hypothetical protein